MASDWIKMRTDLYRDPKVCLIAEYLHSPDGELAKYVSQNCQRNMTITRNVLRNVTCGALVTVWGVTRHRGKRNADDLLVAGVTISVVDDIADLPGLGQAMESVGWLIQNEEGIVFPRFFAEYNVEPGIDAKTKAADRQRKYREKRNGNSNALRDVTVTSQSNAREEKRREEKRLGDKSPKTPSRFVVFNEQAIPESIRTPEFCKTWQRWLDYRRQLGNGKKVTKTGQEAAFKKVEVVGVQVAIDKLDEAMSNGWQGWNFKDEKANNSQQPQPTTRPDAFPDVRIRKLP